MVAAVAGRIAEELAAAVEKIAVEAADLFEEELPFVVDSVVPDV